MRDCVGVSVRCCSGGKKSLQINLARREPYVALPYRKHFRKYVNSFALLMLSERPYKYIQMLEDTTGTRTGSGIINAKARTNASAQ